MPQSNAEKKAAAAAKKRAKEAAREKAKKEAAAAAALAEANKQETPAEKQKRIAREENVKQKMFNIDQENGSAAFMGIYRRLAVRVPRPCGRGGILCYAGVHPCSS